MILYSIFIRIKNSKLNLLLFYFLFLYYFLIFKLKIKAQYDCYKLLYDITKYNDIILYIF